jgi:hypothetical protein
MTQKTDLTRTKTLKIDARVARIETSSLIGLTRGLRVCDGLLGLVAQVEIETQV